MDLYPIEDKSVYTPLLRFEEVPFLSLSSSFDPSRRTSSKPYTYKTDSGQHSTQVMASDGPQSFTHLHGIKSLGGTQNAFELPGQMSWQLPQHYQQARNGDTHILQASAFTRSQEYRRKPLRCVPSLLSRKVTPFFLFRLFSSVGAVSSCESMV